MHIIYNRYIYHLTSCVASATPAVLCKKGVLSVIFKKMRKTRRGSIYIQRAYSARAYRSNMEPSINPACYWDKWGMFSFVQKQSFLIR